MGLFDSLLLGAYEGYRESKKNAKQQAYSEMLQLRNEIDMKERICSNSVCSDCKYGPYNVCELNVQKDMYNEKMDFYVSKGLITNVK